MACLALSIQPVNGPDILLQTREWFPPARALIALASFRQTRLAFSSGKMAAPSDEQDAGIGDDPLAASSGQVIVGKESKYRVVYRLVNGVYVLGITTPDRDDSMNNIFECIGIVNQAVSVVVAACRGVDVTPDKLHRKYSEIYMALDIVLRGVTSIRFASILSSMHGESIAKMVHSGLDLEKSSRGADSWAQYEGYYNERQASVEIFTNTSFELPSETLAAGNEVAITLAPAPQSSNSTTQEPQKEAETQAEQDPFAASDAVAKTNELAGGFKKDKEGVSDVTKALAGLEITTLPPASAAKPTFIGVEGFEGEYGGIEFGNEEATISEAFEGFDDAFGGGLDASEFITTTKKAKPLELGLGGLEELQSGTKTSTISSTDKSTPIESLLVSKTNEIKGPQLYISEEINAEFMESVLSRVGLHAVVYLKTLPTKDSNGKETEISFRLDGTDRIKRAIMQGSVISSLDNGMFHIRTHSADDPVPVLKYIMQPRLIPLPLRVRLVKCHTGTLLSVMIQYVGNPELTVPLRDVVFTLRLPVDPALLKVSPKALLNRSERELRWNVSEVSIKGPPGRLRAQMPVDQDANKGEEAEVMARVKFSVEGSTLSGVSLKQISEGKVEFSEGNHRFGSGFYLCA
ncbi:uncharacterized protein LOC18437863 [Amborella trichopoda]|uniref:MHD domain-containing protein n=1 Tax=Amborella trichopoda TaxID=13333 RepID=W1PPS7_AMBTC|nr:uncharacterized protein LOC18437863 [Amborella trichopoda]XP_020525273.1 uncharacterized protein LOC18437863 [Amborella trichopoda]ERN09706.1 hypothetical protein AMTR_s00029p00220700 [Amborella trichopoda]|eukprot:XP_006848125.1 uncharacterized protein LOC18437863 [Amborella trichopoda]